MANSCMCINPRKLHQSIARLDPNTPIYNKSHIYIYICANAIQKKKRNSFLILHTVIKCNAKELHTHIYTSQISLHKKYLSKILNMYIIGTQLCTFLRAILAKITSHVTIDIRIPSQITSNSEMC